MKSLKSLDVVLIGKFWWASWEHSPLDFTHANDTDVIAAIEKLIAKLKRRKVTIVTD